MRLLPKGHMGFPSGSAVKNLPAMQEMQAGDVSAVPGLGRSPGKRKWQPFPVFLPVKSQSMGSQRVGHNWTTKQQQQQRDTQHVGTEKTVSHMHWGQDSRAYPSTSLPAVPPLSIAEGIGQRLPSPSWQGMDICPRPA